MRSPAEMLGANALDFSPAILRLQREPPSPLPRVVLCALGALLGSVALWSAIGRLDIIAVAPGRLVPVSYVKVVQPVDAGIIKEILVREGDAVKAGLQRVSADASEQPEREVRDAAAAGYRFRSIVELKSQVLESDGVRHPLTPGMQVDAEIALGERSVLEYILSPVRKAFHEAARER